MSDAARRLTEIRRRVAAAEAAAGRPAGSVRLIAVTKFFDAAAVQPLIEAGHRDFGENRVQEAVRKWPPLREGHPGLQLHLIGPLQSNKAADAVRLFDVIHSVDRDKIAAAIASEAAKQRRSPELLVQVNTGGEPQKAGVTPEETVAFIDRCRTVHGLVIEGLMAIPPMDEPPGAHFALLAKLAEVAGVRRISMGMSGDFELAIAFGATDIRVGEAILGPRPASSGIG